MVEDSAADRALWRRYLSAAYECAEEEFGESGLRRCEEFSPDCVILDLNLPDLNGLDFLGRLRDKGHTCAVVVATAYGSEQIESPLASGREQPARRRSRRQRRFATRRRVRPSTSGFCRLSRSREKHLRSSPRKPFTI